MLSNQTYQIPEKESETIEFKVSFNVETIETLVAFANAGGGSIHIGIADTRAIIGVSVGKETVPQWINEIKSKTEPALIPDVTVAEIEGKQIVVLSITEFPIKPVSIKGRYYKRTGHSNQLLTLNEILNMHLKTFNSSWDYYFDPNHSVLDISEEKTLNLIALYNRERVIPIEKNVFEFLSKMELVREGKVTHAAFLLLMKNDSILSDIELGHFQNEITIKDGITISTDLISEVEEVLTFVRKHISKEFIITANPARIERWDYPLEALREIVLNMIVHRNYAHHGNSSVKIFPDRIEFFNPGRLPDNITVNDLLQGTYTSDCRNKLIAKIFKEIDWIERYGTGIRRIRDYFREYGSPEPVFENFQHGFRVIVYPLRREFDNNVIDVIDNVPDVPDNVPDVPDNVPDVPDNVPDNVPDVPDNVPDVIDNVPDVPDNFIENRHTAIINLIKSDAEISIPNLSKSLKVSHKTIQRDIKILKNKGLIERIGNDRGGYWKINENLPLE